MRGLFSENGEAGAAGRALTPAPATILTRDLKLLLEAEIQKQIMDMLSETARDMVSDIEVIEIEDLLACDMETRHEKVQKYVAKVKLMASVCVPLILQSSHVIDNEEAIPAQKDALKEQREGVEVRGCEAHDESHCKTEPASHEKKLEEQNDMLDANDGAIPDAATWVDPEELDVDDFECHNFDADRTEEKFAAGQIWAVYDDKDGMPRNYAYIDKLCGIEPFDVCISWLEPKVRTEEEIKWLKSGNTITCGEFVHQKQTTHITYVECFSHVMKSEIANGGEILIKPEKGDVWALYTTDAPPYRYDIIQIVDEELCSLTVAPLVKVEGFRTRFMQQQKAYKISMDSVAQFSHRIPSYLLGNQEVAGLGTPCCLELDPASTP